MSEPHPSGLASVFDALNNAIDLHEALYMAAGDIADRAQSGAMQALCEVVRIKLAEVKQGLEDIDGQDAGGAR